MEINEKFRRIPYSEAMEKWGSDKPDTRFDMQLKDLSDIVKNCGFSVFTGAIANGGSVRAINANVAHLHIYLRKFGLTVGSQIFVSETLGDLVISVHTGYHKHKVRSRGSNINKNMPTGEVEILAHDLKILSEADVTPFVITEDIKVGEPLRLKYRYLDLRRSALQSKLVMRDKITRVVRLTLPVTAITYSLRIVVALSNIALST